MSQGEIQAPYKKNTIAMLCLIASSYPTTNKLAYCRVWSSLPVVEDKPHKPRPRASDLVLPDDEDEARVTCCGVQEDNKSKAGHLPSHKIFLPVVKNY